jgi:hypothetical protein
MEFGFLMCVRFSSKKAIDKLEGKAFSGGFWWRYWLHGRWSWPVFDSYDCVERLSQFGSPTYFKYWYLRRIGVPAISPGNNRINTRYAPISDYIPGDVAAVFCSKLHSMHLGQCLDTIAV